MMQRFDKIIATVTIALFTCFDASHGLTSGPSMPEYTQFEQVDATDLVSMATGSFSYSIPVMTVPGPGLGFPIVLGYHGSPGVKDEASWVGLGWNLQAGAITRQVNNLPDDFHNVKILESVTSAKMYGWTYGIGYNGATIGVTYKSNEGFGGYVGYNLMQETNSPFSLSLTGGLGSARGNSGISIGISKGFFNAQGSDWGIGAAAGLSVGATRDGGTSASAGIGASVSQSVNLGSGSNARASSSSAGLSSMGVSLAQNGGGGVGVSMLGASLGPTIKGKMNFSSVGATIPIPTPWGLFSFTFNNWHAQMQGFDNDHYYGFLYSDSYSMGCTGSTGSGDVDCNYPNGSNVYRKRQELLAADRPYNPTSEARLMRTTEDVYMVSAQGLAGAFSPHRKEDGDYSNTLENTSKFTMCWDFPDCRDRVDRTLQLGLSRNLLNKHRVSGEDGREDIYWRFNDDAGGSQYSNPSTRDAGALASTQSRRIIPEFGYHGHIEGFKITAIDGVIYEFKFPLNNGWEEKVGSQLNETNPDINSKQEIFESYAYAWLLSAIKSPDYVDLGDAGISNDDIGGWVRFNYGTGVPGGDGKKPIQYWGTPYYDETNPLFIPANFPNGKKQLVTTNPAPRTSSDYVNDGISYGTSRNAAKGLKEIAYLTSIETPSHIAEFATEPRVDNQPLKSPISFTYPSIDPSFAKIELLETTPHSPVARTRARIKLHLTDAFQMLGNIEDSRLRTGTPVDVVIHADYYYPFAGEEICAPSTLKRSFTFNFPGYIVGSDITVEDRYLEDGFIFLPCSKKIEVSKIMVTLPWAAQNVSRKLSSITLKEKAALAESGPDDGSALSPHRGVAYVTFNTDYSLCPGTPNSLAPPNQSQSNGDPVNTGHGKLTLKNIQIGPTDRGPMMPPYAFDYGNNLKYQNSVTINNAQVPWVPWEIGSWDRWGNLCLECVELYHESDVPFSHGRFSQGAWNLDRIKSPSGSEVLVKYAPRAFHFVGAQPVATQVDFSPTRPQYEVLLASGSSDLVKDGQYFKYDVNFAAAFDRLAQRGLPIRRLRIEFKSNKALDGVAIGDERGDVGPGGTNNSPACGFSGEMSSMCLSDCGSGNGLECETHNSVTSIYRYAFTFSPGVDIPNISVAIRNIWVGFSARHGAPSSDPVDWGTEYKLIATIGQNPVADDIGPFWQMQVKEEYANGAIATDVEIRDPYTGKSQNIHYQYENGVTPSLPSTFSSYSDQRLGINSGMEFYSGSPNVLYSKVSTTVNGKNRTVHHFLTPKDLPVIVTDPSSPVVEGNGSKSTQATILDASALWGSLWKKEEYPDGGANPIKTSFSNWGINQIQAAGSFASLVANLPEPGLLSPYTQSASGDYYTSSSPWESEPKSYFGLDQTVFSNRYFNGRGCYAGQGNCPQSNIVTTQVVYKKFNPHSLLETTIQDGVKGTTRFYDYDYRTGVPLKSQQKNSDGTTLVQEKIPAFYRYREMSNRNQLTQEFAQSTYFYKPQDTYVFGSNEVATKAVSSAVTIWRPYDRNQGRLDQISFSQLQSFRKFKAYSWKVDLNSPGVSLSIPADQCTNVPDQSSGTCTSAFTAPLSSEWFLQEQVNRYDGFGHPTNVMDQRNINNTLLYGYGNGLVTAFIENTAIPASVDDGKFQGFQESFERTLDVAPKLSNQSYASRCVISKKEAKTGERALEVFNSPGNYMVCFSVGNLEANKEYEASVWYYDATDGASPSNATATRPGIFLGKDGGCASENHPNGVSGSVGAVPGDANYNDRATGSKLWKRLATSIQAGQCGDQAQLSPSVVCIYSSKGNPGAKVQYDELRVKPSKSYMSSYAYTPAGKISSSMDTRDVITRYEYDEQGNLTGIRNDDGTLVSEQYKKVGQR